jgi:hypothetical protein
MSLSRISSSAGGEPVHNSGEGPTYEGNYVGAGPRAAGLHSRAEDESQKVGKVTKDNMVVLMKMSKSMDQELTRLKQKHLADLNSFKEEIEKERRK